MGSGPVAPAAGVAAGRECNADRDAFSTHGWGLATDAWADVQGLVYSGYGTLPWAQALFLDLTHAQSGWLTSLRAVAPITDGRPIVEPKVCVDKAAAIAFTGTGLAAMGLGEDALKTFSLPFREGMHQQNRRRRLGDDGPTVVDGGPQWSGNTPTSLATPAAVHALLLVYHRSEPDLDQYAEEARKALLAQKVVIVREIKLDIKPDQCGKVREHFGFADGVSQPLPYLDNGRDGPPGHDPWNEIPLGEVLIGYRNAHAEIAPGPQVPAADSAARWELLDSGNAPEGFRDLGLNGTYMVVRELRQDVGRFWTSLETQAGILRRQGGDAGQVTAEWLAERIVGRDRDGRLLCPVGTSVEDGDNRFGFRSRDPHGFGCPLGSHVRRANPRDGLAPDEDSAETLRAAANNHRIMRRGRKFGKTTADPRHDDGEERGLLFICLNTDIARQFEFVQQTWLLNPNFATLYQERDPLVGPNGPLTIPQDPLRRIVDVETYIKLVGGEYFFLPGIRALAYLESL